MHRRELLKILGFTSAAGYISIPHEVEAASVTELFEAAPATYDVVIYGGTPGGVALAVRSAREGLKVLLVNHNQHLGGMFANGLGTMDTLYNGARSPLYDEYRFSIHDYYRRKYGRDSKQYEATQPGFPKTRYESHVAELLIDKMVNRESNITVVKDFYPVAVKKNGRTITEIEFQRKGSTERMTATGNTFADCSYEGDLIVVAGVKYRIGRESKQEFNESHAGITYTQKNFWPPPASVDKEFLKYVRSMNVVLYNTWSDLIYPQSTHEADKAIQAFNIRTTLCADPELRVIPTTPPRNYDAKYIGERFANQTEGPGLGVPNMKTSWNQPELVGEQNPYVEGTWEQREQIMQKFRDATLGVLYFNQNDPSVPEEKKKRWREYGLSKNEYADNGNLPYELYVREARRIEGLSVFTQHDGELAPGAKRAPVHGDSISVTEWFMDSHACTEHEIPGSKPEGEVMMKNLTFPGQVSFDTIFPKDLDNFIVPVCLSSTHVGWGTIRLEPTWMSICEAAGYALVMASKQKIAPGKIDRDALLRTLADKRIMISFFNDVEQREYEEWYPAVQYLGTKGFFGTYECMAEDSLTNELANEWLTQTAAIVKKSKVDYTEVSKKMISIEASGKGTITADAFAKKLNDVVKSKDASRNPATLLKKFGIASQTAISRGDACWLIYEATRS